VIVDSRARKEYGDLYNSCRKSLSYAGISAVHISLKHVSQEGDVSINDSPQFHPSERTFRTDIHPACMDERGRVFMDKQMFCLMWDFKFDLSREMDKKY